MQANRVRTAVVEGLVMALLLAGLGCTTPANWKPAPNYVGLGAAFAFEHFDLDDAEEGSGLDLGADDALGGEVRVGRRVHPMLELELRAQAFDAFEIDASDGSSSEVDLWALTFDVKLHENPSERWFPELGERCLPYLVLGLGTLQAELDDPTGFLGELDSSAGLARGGFGLEVFWTDSLAWYFEGSVLEPFNDLDGLTLLVLSVGLQWRF
jgi:hypothetical protein